MGTIWRKVWRDLWQNKLRTLMVILSTSTGVFALGLVFGLYSTMTVRLDESLEASVPAHLVFRTGLFDKSLVDTVKSEPGVSAVEGEARAGFQWKLEGERDWRAGDLFERALAAWGSLRSQAAFGGWLFRIAHNTVAEYYRGRRQVTSLDRLADVPAGDVPAEQRVERAEELALLEGDADLLQDAREKLAELRSPG